MSYYFSMMPLAEPTLKDNDHLWYGWKIKSYMENYWIVFSINVLISRQSVKGPQMIRSQIMMTSSNENIFRVNGLCVGNSPVTDEFSSQRPVTWGFDVFFDLRLNKRLSQQSRRGDLRRHRVHYDVTVMSWALPCSMMWKSKLCWGKRSYLDGFMHGCGMSRANP